MPKVDKIERLVKDLGLNEKEKNSFTDRAKRLKPKQIKDHITQFTKAVRDYEKGLEEIKSRKWNPETKSIEIPLEGGKKKLMTFKNEEKFNEWHQADIDNVSRHIEHDKDKIREWNILKKFKEA